MEEVAYMRSRSSGGFAVGGVEAVWLALIVLLPLAFNAYAESNFALPKAVWLRLLVPLGVVAAVASVRFRDARHIATTASVGAWLAPLLLVGALLASTAMGASPGVSFWGTELRGGGTLTILCQLALVAMVATGLRRERQWRRLIFAALLAGSLTSILALAQSAGLDPFLYSLSYDGQASATMAHPSALGAYLVLPALLALEQVFATWTRSRRRYGVVLVFAVILGLIALALEATRSRGAILALAGGLLVWWLLATLVARAGSPATGPSPWRLMRPAVPLMVIVTLAVGGVALLAYAPLQSLRLGVDRPSDAMDVSVLRRALMWETAAEALWEGPPLAREPQVPPEYEFGTPMRTLIGYGPGAAGVVLAGHYPEARAQRLARATDSSHNLVYDLLLTLGFLGFGVALWCVLAVIRSTTGSLGLVGSGRQDDLLLAALLGGGVVGFLAPIALTRAYDFTGAGLLTLSGPGLALGVLGGWIVFLAVRNGLALDPGAPIGCRARTRRRLCVLTAALVAHYFLLQVGIAGIAANTNAMIALGAILALGRGDLAGSESESANSDWMAGLWMTVLAALTLLVGFSGAPTGLDPLPLSLLEMPVARVDLMWMAMSVIAAVGVSVVIFHAIYGGVVPATRAALASRSGRARIAPTLLAAAALLMAAAVVAGMPRGVPASDPMARLDSIVLLGRFVAVATLGIVGMLAWACAPEGGPSIPSSEAPRRLAVGFVALAVVGALVGANPVAWQESNVAIRRGGAHLNLAEYDVALAMHERAVRQWPFGVNSWYATSQARARAALERLGSESTEADAERAVATLEQAVAMEPWSPTRLAELAGAHLLLISTEPDRLEAGRLEEAARLLRIASYLQPSSWWIRSDLNAVRVRLAQLRRRQ
jgi:hypothetical protein